MSTSEIVYSSAPAASIDVSSLTSSRFLLPRERRFPFRDALGRVNVRMVEASLRAAAADAPAEVVDKLRAWQRHATRSIAARPADERLTLEQLCADSSDDDEARSAGEREAPGTVAVKRRGALRHELLDEEDDEVTADRAHLARCAAERGSCRKRRRVEASSGSEREDDESGASDDVYEVEEILAEEAGKGFRIRWLGYGAAHDTWEPEDNVAPELVAAFRAARDHKSSHVCSDYLEGRTRFLWCATCGEHRPSDSFSANMRRAAPAARSCLHHAYKTSATATAHATPDRRRARRFGHSATTPGGSSPQPPPLPHKRPALARELASRQPSLSASPVARLFPDAVRAPERSAGRGSRELHNW